MLIATTNQCVDCGSVQKILSDINCTLAIYGRNHWMNISFDSCAQHEKSTIKAILHYKRILTKKLYNPDYACGVELASIISRVKTLLVRKDCCSISDACEFPTAATFEEVSAP